MAGGGQLLAGGETVEGCAGADHLRLRRAHSVHQQSASVIPRSMPHKSFDDLQSMPVNIPTPVETRIAEMRRGTNMKCPRAV